MAGSHVMGDWEEIGSYDCDVKMNKLMENILKGKSGNIDYKNIF